MRIGFSINGIKNREVNLAMDFAQGLRRHDIDFETIDYDRSFEGFDLVCIIGVKSMKRIEDCKHAGIPFLYFDKGYSRKAGYWRIAINNHQPTDYFSVWDYPDDRRLLFGWNPKPWKRDKFKNTSIMLAGSSAKFHEFKGLVGPTQYAIELIKEIREYTQRRIIYRPKPSWKDAEHINGTVYSREKGIIEVFEKQNVGVMVTYGSNASFEAMVEGIPTIVLGDAVTKSISCTQIRNIKSPYQADESDRIKLLNNLAYCQFSPVEMQNGLAWEIINRQLQS